jgi:hypothetical protein
MNLLTPAHLLHAGLIAAGLTLGWGVTTPAAAAPKDIGSASTFAYSCVDANGRKLTSDRLIAACMDREQREISPNGTVRVIAPRATAKELEAQAHAEREASDKRRAEARERAAERALLSRYPTKAALEAERAKALKLTADLRQSAEHRIATLSKDRKVLDEEMEFYAKDPARAPADLRRKYDANDAELAAQRLTISNQQAEAKRINTRFDQEAAKLSKHWQ